MKPVLLFIILFLNMVFAPAGAVQIESWETDNGVSVLFIETHELPIVDMRLGFRAASSRDGELPGISSLVSGLLVEGTGELSAQQIAQAFEQVGALLGNQSSRDMAWTSLRSLSDITKLEAVVDLFGRVTALPSFPQVALERDRKGLLANLAERQKRIASIASDHFYQALYENHPYGYSNEEVQAAIEVITVDDLVKFHRRYYVAENASLAIVGDLTISQAKHYANRVTRYLRAGKVAGDLPVPKQITSKTLSVNFTSEQTSIKIGMPLISRHDPDYYIFMVGNHILGGNGSNSRLMQIIREEHGLSYNVYSYIAPLESQGPFEMGLQTRNHQVDAALKLLDESLDAFIKNGPTQTELDQAKSNLIGGFALRLDSNRKLLGQLSVIGFYQLPLDYLDKYSKQIESVTADDIRRVFQKRLKPEQMIRVIVGPARKTANETG